MVDATLGALLSIVIDSVCAQTVMKADLEPPQMSEEDIPVSMLYMNGETNGLN